MSQPVWVLSVDLQTKTATFQSGMAEAAKSARGAFTDIQSGAGDMAETTGNSFGSVRNKIGLLDNSIRGNHAAAMADLIHMFSQTTVVMNALPLMATAGGILLLGGVIVEVVKAFKDWQQVQEKLKGEQTEFGTSIQSVFNGLNEKLTQAGIRADELRNDHLGALRGELKLIDEQSMDELIRAFAEIDKAADQLFGDLKAHWYEMGIGSEGAKHALDEFQTQYKSLLAQGKDGDATNLLHGTLDSAKQVLAYQKEAAANKPTGSIDSDAQWAAAEKYHTAINALKRDGVGYTEKEVAAQQALVDALNAQVTVESKVASLKTVDKGNATRQTGNEAAAMQAQAAREAAEHTEKMGELGLAAQKEQAETALTIQAASIQQRLASDIALTDKEYGIKSAANQAQIAALNKSGNDYNNQLAALRDKAVEIEAEHSNAIAALKGRAAVEQNEKDLQDMQEAEREAINATQQGSAARLAAVDAAIKAEAAKNLEATEHYRELLTSRVEVARQMAAEEAKAKADAAKESADNEAKVGEMTLAAYKESQALIDSSRRMSRQQQMQEEMNAANQEYALKLTALKLEEDALDKSGKDYENKLKSLQDKETQLVQQHENQITQIRNQAQMERNQKILSAENQYASQVAATLTQSIMGHQSWASAITSLGNQVVSGLMQQAIKHIEMNLMTKESDAAKAARAGFNAGLQFPWPANIVMGPVLGAAMFAEVMAFQEGGIVPGVGKGDIVPAMLEPGEGVVKNSAMEKLNKGDVGNQTHFHVQAHYAPQVHAIDATGVDKMLTKHSQLFQRHFTSTVRKMNKG